MKNIHILPTDKPSRLIFDKEDKTFLPLQDEPIFMEHQDLVENQHIYITSDEEIKEENLTKSIYVIDVQNGNIGKLTCKNRFFKGSCKLIGIEWSNKQDIWNYYHIKEIILTTDQDLIKYGIQPIDDEFLEWFVKNPSCEKVEIEYLVPKVDNPFQQGILNGLAKSHPDIVKKPYIIIPKEEQKQHLIDMMRNDEELGLYDEPKQETLEEAAERYRITDGDYDLKTKIAFEQGAKWKAERMYSEEEVMEMFHKLSMHLPLHYEFLVREMFKKK
jgi:hypothetical protein